MKKKDLGEKIYSYIKEDIEIPVLVNFDVSRNPIGKVILKKGTKLPIGTLFALGGEKKKRRVKGSKVFVPLYISAIPYKTYGEVMGFGN